MEILSMPNNKPYGLYSCPTHLLKEVSHIISQPLAFPLNMPVSLGTYPRKLKISENHTNIQSR